MFGTLSYIFKKTATKKATLNPVLAMVFAFLTLHMCEL